MSGQRPGRLLALGVVVVGLAALAVLMVLRWGEPAAADAPHNGLDLSIAVDVDGGGDDCDSSGTGGLPTKCSLPATDSVFTMKLRINALAGIEYTGFDAYVSYSGVASQDNASSASWPDCVFPAAIYESGSARFGCAEGPSSTPSAYTGAVSTLGYDCAQGGGSITLNHGQTDTAVSDGAGTHSEGAGTTESLTINCGGTANTATLTPTITPTDTITPTNTAVPSATATLSPTPCGFPGSTCTPTLTSTATATRTATNTVAPPTQTNTSAATATFTVTSTATHTATATNTVPPTPTFTVTNTATSTNTPTNSPTNTVTNTPTNTFTATNSPTVTSTPTPPAAADLTVTKTDSQDPIVAGRPISFTINVSNEGDLKATFVRLVDTPDVNFTYTGFATSQGTCGLDGSVTGGKLDCDLGSLPPGELATIFVTGRFAAIVDHDVKNTATVDPKNVVPESHENNNTASEQTRLMVQTPTPPSGATPTSPHPSPTFVFIQGDTDGDGEITALDAWWVLLFESGLADDVPVHGAGDVTKDGLTNALDALTILFYDAGLIHSFPGP